jgi:hypothetical protein
MKKLKNLKKKGKRGGGGGRKLRGGLAKGGGSSHPIFGQGVARATPTASLGLVEPPPWPKGWFGHPQKPPPPKKKEGNWGLAWPRGVATATPIFGQRMVGATPTVGLGVVEPPPWPRGWFGHPQKPRSPPKKGKEIGGWLGQGRWFQPPYFWPRGGSSHPHGRFRGGQTIPMAKRVIRLPQKPKKKGGRKSGGWLLPPHFWRRGGWSHPHGRSGGGRTTPMAKGVVWPPPWPRGL